MQANSLLHASKRSATSGPIVEDGGRLVTAGHGGLIVAAETVEVRGADHLGAGEGETQLQAFYGAQVEREVGVPCGAGLARRQLALAKPR